MRFTLRSLLLLVLVLCGTLAVVRARFFPPPVRVHLMEPGQYNVDGVDFNAAGLKTHLTQRVKEIRNTIYYPEMVVMLPVDRKDARFDNEYHELTIIGCGAGFDRVGFTRHPDE